MNDALMKEALVNEAAMILLYLASAGMVFAALRARYKFGPTYSVRRVRLMGACYALVGVIGIGLAVYEIATTGRTFEDILRLVTGFQFVLAGSFFWYAATHRPFLTKELH